MPDDFEFSAQPHVTQLEHTPQGPVVKLNGKVVGPQEFKTFNDRLERQRQNENDSAIMAGAVKNLWGPAKGASLVDGAGIVDYLNTQFYRAAFYLEGENNHYLDCAGACPGNETGYYDITYNLDTNRRVRAVMVWSSGGAWPFAKNGEPQMDLNLSVYAPNGTLIQSSQTANNSFELLDFCTHGYPSGTYRFRINRQRNSYGTVTLPSSNVAGIPSGQVDVPKSKVKLALSIGYGDISNEGVCPQ